MTTVSLYEASAGVETKELALQKKHQSILIGFITIGMITVFAADIVTRLGITAWLPYLLLLVASARVKKNGFSKGLMVVIIGLIVVAHFFKPPGDSFASIVNRGFGIVTVISMLFVIELYQRARWELERSSEEALRANRSKSNFIVMMNHELRTPLTSILGFSEFIVTEPLGPIGSPKYTPTPWVAEKACVCRRNGFRSDHDSWRLFDTGRQERPC